jgi:2-O-methyltransferase
MRNLHIPPATDPIYEFLRAGFIPTISPATIVEVGAHIGVDTMRMRQLFPSAHIYAIEPDPRNIMTIKRVEIDKVVTLIEAAISDTDGETTMFLSGGRPPGTPKENNPVGWTASSSIKKPDQVTKVYPWLTFEGRAKVKTMTLDTLVTQRGIKTIDFLWADVQGAEAELIAGGQQALTQTRFFFTEFGFERLYDGELNAEQIQTRLPGNWEVIHKWKWDVLLRNKALT